MPQFRPAEPHGPLVEVFPDVFRLAGGWRFGPGLSINRNMTVVRQGEELAIVNSVRLSPEGEEALLRLGRPRHLLRIGAFHGADDPWFVHRFGMTLWAPPGTRYEGGQRIDEALAPGHCPLEGTQVFSFDHGHKPELALCLPVDGGVLVPCDSYQHWPGYDGCSLLGQGLLRVMGFGPTLIGGPWVRAMGPGVRQDFERLKDLPFRHLLPAHGSVLRDRAREGLDTAIAHRFGP